MCKCFKTGLLELVIVHEIQLRIPVTWPKLNAEYVHNIKINTYSFYYLKLMFDLKLFKKARDHSSNLS